MADNKPGLLLMCHGDFPGNFFTDPRNRKLYADCLAAASINQGEKDRPHNDDLRILSHLMAGHLMAASSAGQVSLKGVEVSYLMSGSPGIGQAIANAAIKDPRAIVCAGAAGLMMPGHSTLDDLPRQLSRVRQERPMPEIKYTGPWMDTSMAADVIQRSIEYALGGSPEASATPAIPQGADDLSVVLVNAPDHSIRTYEDAASEFARAAAMLSNRSSRWHDAGICSEVSDFMENVSSTLKARGFSAVEAGFIDFATPGIDDAALRLIDQGADHIVVAGVPTLLHRNPLSIIGPDEAVKWLQAMIPYACIRHLKAEPAFVARMLSGRMASSVLDARSA